MTKSLEDELNLPRIADALKELEQQDSKEDQENQLMTPEEISKALANMSELSRSLKTNDDFSENETKLDDLQDAAVKAHQDLLDAGFNVDPKNAEAFLAPATQFLSIALDSEKQKIDRKIKLLKLQLETDKLELAREKLELDRRKVDIAERQLTGDGVEVLETNEASFRAKRSEILRLAEIGNDEE